MSDIVVPELLVRGHHLANLWGHRNNDTPPEQFRMIFQHPGTIRFTDSLDVICGSCNNEKKRCVSRRGEIVDRYWIGAFGMNIDEPQPAADVAEQIRAVSFDEYQGMVARSAPIVMKYLFLVIASQFVPRLDTYQGNPT